MEEKGQQYKVKVETLPEYMQYSNKTICPI